MRGAEFKPGFRLSGLDAFVTTGGALISALAWHSPSKLGLLLAFVLGHFFLFCNVFRVSRTLELIWSVVFLGEVTFALLARSSNWTGAILWTLPATIAVVVVEMRKPSYHGIGWKRLNPGLLDWWDRTSNRGKPL